MSNRKLREPDYLEAVLAMRLSNYLSRYRYRYIDISSRKKERKKEAEAT